MTKYIDKAFEIARSDDWRERNNLACELCDIVRPMSVAYSSRREWQTFIGIVSFFAGFVVAGMLL
jgi:hypothetical protein